MIGELPVSLEVGGRLYAIRTDFRVILNIFSAFNDPELTDREKCYVCLKCLYEDLNVIPRDSIQEAIEKAYWFVGGGDIPQEDNTPNVRLFDWDKDGHIIFPEINKAAGQEVRQIPYMHWWTFLGYFSSIGEGIFSTVVNIRSKKAKGKKLEKWEKDFMREHKKLIALHSSEEQAAIDETEAFLREIT